MKTIVKALAAALLGGIVAGCQAEGPLATNHLQEHDAFSRALMQDQTPVAQAAPGRSRVSGGVVLSVLYGDSLPATQALYAVRVCAYDEASGAAPELRETRAAPGFDSVLVRLMDRDGREVSHFEGTSAICDYAHFAASFAARAAAQEGQRHE